LNLFFTWSIFHSQDFPCLTAMNRHIAVVTPVLDDWACFSALVMEISNRYTGTDLIFHIYGADDGSIESLDAKNIALPADSCVAAIEILHLALNLGHQRAIAVGLCAIADRAHFDAVLVMDSDGEDRAIDIAVLLAASLEHPAHVVLARRAKRSESTAFRFWYFVYRLGFHLLSGQAINFGNYSLIPMSAVQRLVHMPELWNNLAACILRSRLPCTTVPTVRGARYTGRSTMNLVSLVVHGLSVMSVHSDVIFVRALLVAAFVASVSIAGIAAVTITRLATDLAIPGWATTAVGGLLIILLQTVVIITAASLTMLAGRSNRPIIPILDCAPYIVRREVVRRERSRLQPEEIIGDFVQPAR
jgi:polyisoprenyl-phosphate glycosyltransferase